MSALFGGNTWFIVVGALGMLFMFGSAAYIFYFMAKKAREEREALEKQGDE